MGDLFQTEEKPITEADRLRLGGELAKVEIELAAKKAEKRKVNSNYRVAINKLEEACTSLSTQLDGGRVQFKFAIDEVPDDERQLICIVRSDTRELVGERPMNEAEKEERRARLQPGLFEERQKRDTDRAPPPRPAKSKKPTKKKNGKG